MGIASGIGMVLGFASMAVIVRYVAPAEFGAFVLLQVFFIFLSEVSGFGMTLAVPRLMTSTEDPQRQWDVINTALYFRLATVAVVSGLLFLGGPSVMGWFDSPLLAALMIYLPVLFALESLGKLFKAILQGFFRFKAIGIVEFLSSGANFALVLVLLIYFEAGLQGVVYAKVLSLLIAYGYAYLRASIRHQVRFDVPLLKEMLVFGVPLQANYVMSFIFMRIDTLIIGAMLGAAGTAFYEVARRIPDSLFRFYEAFRAVYYPSISSLFAQGQRDTATRVLNNSVRWVSFVTILGAMIALLFGEDIITLLFSADYRASVPAFVLLMVALNLTMIETTLGYSLVAIGDSDQPLIINVVRSITSLVCNIVLIPQLGFVGAALASIIGNVVTIPLNILFLWKRDMYARFWAGFAPVAIFGACSLLFVVLAVSLPVFKMAILALFLMACVLFSVVRLDDMTAIVAQARHSHSS
jgi:O-antigen/teichoic acid export membrane protein